MRHTEKYKANRKIDNDKVIEIFNKNSLFNDGFVTKAYLFKGIIYFSTNNRLLIIELEKTFPNVFIFSDIFVPNDSEELFINE